MADEKPRSLSTSESLIVLGLEEKGERRLTRQSVIEQLKTSPKSADQTIRSLREKGWIEKTGWGRYLLVPAEYGPEKIGEASVLALATHIVEPYYFAWSTAARIHGLTPQSRSVIWIATTKQVRPRRLRNHLIRIAQVKEDRFFGIEKIERESLALYVTDRDRTLLDCVDKPRRAGGLSEVAAIISFARKEINWDRLLKHAIKFDITAAIQRFGWLADRMEIPFPRQIRDELKKLIRPERRTYLNPDAKYGSIKSHRSYFDSEWNLIINVPDEILRGDTSMAPGRS
jgi:predicted transcriptional regulator of viral defense system